MADYVSLDAIATFCDKIIERDPTDDNPVTKAFKAFKFYAQTIPRLSLGIDVGKEETEHD